MIEKTALGTVQLGLNYGVNNKHGKPSRKDAAAMLSYAYSSGIRMFDTANAYGNAEEVIKDFLKEGADRAKEVRTVSKLKPHTFIDADSLTEKEITNRIEEEVKKSLARLGRDFLDGYLFHTPEYIRNKNLVAAMEHLKERGLVKNVGVSIYETEDALYAADLPVVDYIQIPYNIFDQRLARNDFFRRARGNNVTVFARSPFLQGLMFMEPEEVPDSVAPAREHLRVFRNVVERHGFSAAEATLLFSYTNPDIDYVVFGVDTKEQLEENLVIVKQAKNVGEEWKDCRKELENNFLNMEKHVIFPSLWKNP